ncbi:hypothetical protein F5884DRAFT_509210 [Xylogone sp. PMI_703]|nr:hypothetical protein F5884DRAFT_509210 [Xylogone sp. PMI_703]
MGQYFENWLKEVTGTPEAKALAILPKLLELSEASAASASSVAKGALNRARLTGPLKVAERSSKRIKLLKENEAESESVGLRRSSRLFVGPSRVLASSPAIKTTVSAGFHDIIIANLIGNTDLETQYGHNISLPATIPAAQVLADGMTPSWVDLPTYITLMESSNSQFVPTKLQPRLDISYFQAMKWWFLNVDGTKPESTILASMLLGALLNESAAELFISLPLNMKGAAAFGNDPFAAFGAGLKPPKNLPTNAMMNLVLQNFAAEVVVPTAAQYVSV